MLREQDAESASWGLEKLLKMQGHKAELKLLNKSVLEVQKLARQWDGEEDDEEMEEAELVQPRRRTRRGRRRRRGEGSA